MQERYDAYMMRRMREEDEKELARQKSAPPDPVEVSVKKLISSIDRIEKKLDYILADRKL